MSDVPHPPDSRDERDDATVPDGTAAYGDATTEPAAAEAGTTGQDVAEPEAAEAETAEPEVAGRSRGKGEKEMSFLDHLEELRWRIIYTVLGILGGAAAVWFFIDPLMELVLLRPAVENGMTLQNLRPFGQFFLYMQVALFAGLVVSLPNTLMQVWMFVAPGLYPRERRFARWIVFFTSLCFLAGVAFAYLVILPAAFSFFSSFGTPQIENNISIDEYFSFLLGLMLGAGLVFEMPMLSFFLSKLGLLTPRFMRKYWRHAFVLILVASAIITPTPDPYNMLLLSIPMVGLYELSIWISKISHRKRRVEEDEEAAAP